MKNRQKEKLIKKYGFWWISSGRKPWKKKHSDILTVKDLIKLSEWALKNEIKPINGYYHI
jgi:hypothetical protein